MSKNVAALCFLFYAFATFHFHGFKRKYDGGDADAIVAADDFFALFLCARKYVYGTDTEITDAMHSSMFVRSVCNTHTICTPSPQWPTEQSSH